MTLVGVVSSCGAEREADPSAAQQAAARTAVVDNLAARIAMTAGFPPLYQSPLELLPNVKFKVDSAPAEALSDAVVTGRITEVEPGVSQVSSGEDSVALADFEDCRAMARTLHLEVSVDEELGPTDVSGSVRVGLAIGASVDPNEMMAGLESLGQVLLFLSAESAVFDYDPSLYRILENGALLGVVGADGRVEFPVQAQLHVEGSLSPEEMREFSQYTVDDLREAAAEPERVISLSTPAGGGPPVRD